MILGYLTITVHCRSTNLELNKLNESQTQQFVMQLYRKHYAYVALLLEQVSVSTSLHGHHTAHLVQVSVLSAKRLGKFKKTLNTDHQKSILIN